MHVPIWTLASRRSRWPVAEIGWRARIPTRKYLRSSPEGAPRGVGDPSGGRTIRSVEEGTNGPSQRAHLPLDARTGSFRRPKSESSPKREREFGVDGPAFVWIRGKSNSQREHIGVACEFCPLSSHLRLLIPMFPDVLLLHAPLRPPFVPQAFRNFDPSSGVAMPDLRAVLLSAVRYLRVIVAPWLDRCLWDTAYPCGPAARVACAWDCIHSAREGSIPYPDA